MDSDWPQQKQYNLTHYQQRSNWDCGISCILIILSATQREEFLNNFETICYEEGFSISNSTWTIDLCYMLQRFHVKHEYFTKTLGIDPEYVHHSYYKKIIEIDQERILKKFSEAKQRGLIVKQMTLPLTQILWHLAKFGPVILLTNASSLRCNICKKDVMHKIGYAGHYVVLSGYNLKNKSIFYHNPEVKDGHICYCSMDAIDAARKAYGTDEDVILIYYKM